MRAPLVDDITELMRVLGREPRPVILRSGLRRLPQATTLDATINLWTLEPVDQVVDLGDYLEPTTWRVGLNRLAKPPELGATWNSYWSAIAMLIYGDPELWFWVKAQHLAFFCDVFHNNKHPRHQLYKSLEKTETGDSNVTIWHKLLIPDAWIEHELIQQVTADLYSIFLVTFTYESANATERKPTAEQPQLTKVTVRGSYNAPHRAVRFLWGAEYIYQPMAPRNTRYSEFRFPETKFKDTKRAEFGLADHDLPGEANYGIRHPYRRLSLDKVVPEKLVPRTVIPVPLDSQLAQVLWVRFWSPGDVGPSGHSSPIKIVPRTLTLTRNGGQKDVSKPASDSDGHGSNKGVQLGGDNRSDHPEDQPEKLNLELDKSGQRFNVPRNEYVAANRWRLEDIMNPPEPAGTVLYDTTTKEVHNQEFHTGRISETYHITAIVHKITSVLPELDGIRVPRPHGSDEPPAESYANIHLNSDFYLHQILSSADLPILDDREENIRACRAHLNQTHAEFESEWDPTTLWSWRQ